MRLPAERRARRGWGRYLREGERVGHGTDEDLAQFPVQIGAFNPVQVGVHPEDPAENIKDLKTT